MSIIGKKTKSRGTWGGINPVTRVKESKKNAYSRKENKRETRERVRDYE
jgi:hypothetical protein